MDYAAFLMFPALFLLIFLGYHIAFFLAGAGLGVALARVW